MADKTLEQMLEHLVNDEKEKAEELFHEYVVAKSREIYESLIEAEDDDEDEEVDEAKDDDDEDKVDEAKDDDDDEEVSEELFDITPVGEGPAGGFGGDETDDLAGEIEMDMDGDDDMGGDDMDMDDEGGEGEEAVMQDLEDIIGELQAKFDELKGDEADQGEFDMDAGDDDMDDGEDDEGDDDMDDGEDDEMKDSFDQELATVREYVEKVAGGHGAEKKGAAEQADNKKSLIDNMKNDMGGTTANILSGKGEGTDKGTAGGLANNKPQENNAGNINVPGGKAGSAFSKKEPGHGAEKKGAAEGSTDGQSLFRGRR